MGVNKGQQSYNFIFIITSLKRFNLFLLIGWFLSLVYHKWIVLMSVICHTIRQSFMCVCDVPTLSAIITIWSTGPNLIAMCTTILHTAYNIAVF